MAEADEGNPAVLTNEQGRKTNLLDCLRQALLLDNSSARLRLWRLELRAIDTSLSPRLSARPRQMRTAGESSFKLST